LLPPEIGELANLELLEMFGNQLTSLPPEFSRLPQLKMLYLDGNPLLTIRSLCDPQSGIE
jgi:internalin A